MRLRIITGLPVVMIGAITLATSTGCATKKYVRNTVNPVQQRVGELDRKTAENAGAIDELETSLSRTNERALTADAKASDAAEAASRANEQAALANKGVGEAKLLADRAQNSAGVAAWKAENIDNYKLVSTENVLFGFNRSDLNDQAKDRLDEAVGKISARKHFVVEVQGFTDTTGSSQYNLELSRRRAASVVRYLTLEHEIPLHRVHTLGYGEEEPAADNATREGRQQNRRVEVRIFVADLEGEPQISSLSK
jgi:OOP family OmpA-OmpF porin